MEGTVAAEGGGKEEEREQKKGIERLAGWDLL